MIEVVFLKEGESLVGFTVSGHAGYANEGEDIICAAVTSATELTANAITEVLGVSCDIAVKDDTVRLKLPKVCNDAAELFLRALSLHLENLSHEYNKYIHFMTLEV